MKSVQGQRNTLPDPHRERSLPYVIPHPNAHPITRRYRTLYPDAGQLLGMLLHHYYFAMAMTLGMVLASFAGGLLLDHAGVRVLLAFATLAGAVGMVILFAKLQGGKKATASQSVPQEAF